MRSSTTFGGRLKIDYTAVALGGLPHYIIAEHTSEQNGVYLRDQQVLLKEGAKIMSCTYDAIGVLNTVSYWYRDMPKSMYPASLRASSPNHPLLKVLPPRTNYPLTMPQ